MKRFLIFLLLSAGCVPYGSQPPTVVVYQPLTGATQIDDGTDHYHGSLNPPRNGYISRQRP